MNTKNPSYIVLCGGEGSGKSTMIEALKEEYQPVSSAAPEEVVFTREPGGTPFGIGMRELILESKKAVSLSPDTMLLGMWTDRVAHMSQKIVPAIKAGQHVISDRGDCCTFAYQIYGQQMPEREELFWMMRKNFFEITKPDLYIFLDVPVEEGLRRVAGRPGKKNHFDDREMAFHERVRKGYGVFLSQIPQLGSRAVTVDANRPLQEVQAEVLNIVDAEFNNVQLDEKKVNQ